MDRPKEQEIIQELLAALQAFGPFDEPHVQDRAPLGNRVARQGFLRKMRNARAAIAKAEAR